MNRARVLCLLVATAATAACHDSSSGSSNPGGTGITVTNLGVSATEFSGEGSLFVASVSEADEGADLNGDGDTADLVAHVLDIRSGLLVNLGLATRPVGPSPADILPPALPQVSGDTAVFVVSEASQGDTDLNGDGDVLDFVLHVHDSATGATSNTRFAASVFGDAGLSVTEDSVAFAVSEFDQAGVDMNGDGDSTDSILHVLDLETSIIVGILSALGSVEIAVEENYVAYFVAESLLVGDLNGDGDLGDPGVLHVYDTRSGSVTNTNLATLGARGLFAGGAWLFPVREAEQANADLNGDGDADDVVLHTYAPAAGIARNLGIAANQPYHAVSDAGLLTAPVLETQMGADLNGDGDELDHVIHLIDPATGVVTNTELAGSFSGSVSFLDDWLAVQVFESSQGNQDLNGDGDVGDRVPHVVDLFTGASQNLGVEGLFFFTSERFLLIQRLEFEANEDFNQDGDLDDVMLFSWDSRTGALAGTGTSTGGVMGFEGSTVLHIVADFFEGDVNGDGDLRDTTAVAVDLVSGRRIDLGLSPAFGRLASEDTALILVSEYLQEEDLNDDGDLDDSVLFQVDLFR